MSDGLPERFNEAGEMFGYERSKASLLDNAPAGPKDVAEGLLQASETWAAGKTANDDMTFVAVKLKEAA